MSNSDFNYIVVEGPIGVGKTTLTRKLAASFGGETLMEAPEENPFLPRFYENPKPNALSTQLFFLLQRVRQVQDLHQRDMFRTTTVADYMIEKDRMFAELNLDPEEFSLYDQLYQQVVGDTVKPDLVIYLQAPVNVLLDRIAQRGIEYEATIDADYLQRLVKAYTHYFYHFEEAPLVIVNAAEIDYANKDEDYQMLFEQLQTIQKGRHYLNPLPF